MMTPGEILMTLSQAGGSCCSERCYPQKKAREALVLMKESALEQAAMMAERSQGMTMEDIAKCIRALKEVM